MMETSEVMDCRQLVRSLHVWGVPFLPCLLSFFFFFSLAFWWLTLWVKTTSGSLEGTGGRVRGNGCVISTRSGPHRHRALIPTQGQQPECEAFHWPPCFVRLHTCGGSSRAAGSAARRNRWRSNESGVTWDAAFNLSFDAALRWLVVGLKKFCTSSYSFHFQNISFLWVFRLVLLSYFIYVFLLINWFSNCFLYILKWKITFNSKCLHH